MDRNIPNFCSACLKEFSYRRSFLRHVKKYHPQLIDHQKTLERETHKAAIKERLSKVDTSVENIEFSSKQQFLMWKDQIEKLGNLQYVKKTGDKQNSCTIISRYYCNRSGFYNRRGSSKRSLKRQGSNKINGICPSKIILAINTDNGKLNVEYFKAHFGHELDARHCPLSYSDKKYLTDLISANISFEVILKDFKESARDTNIERRRLLTKKDLLNIAKRFKLKYLENNVDNDTKASNTVIESGGSPCNDVVDDQTLIISSNTSMVFDVSEKKNVDPPVNHVTEAIEDKDLQKAVNKNINLVQFENMTAIDLVIENNDNNEDIIKCGSTSAIDSFIHKFKTDQTCLTLKNYLSYDATTSNDICKAKCLDSTCYLSIDENTKDDFTYNTKVVCNESVSEYVNKVVAIKDEPDDENDIDINTAGTGLSVSAFADEYVDNKIPFTDDVFIVEYTDDNIDLKTVVVCDVLLNNDVDFDNNVANNIMDANDESIVEYTDHYIGLSPNDASIGTDMNDFDNFRTTIANDTSLNIIDMESNVDYLDPAHVEKDVDLEIAYTNYEIYSTVQKNKS